MSSGGPWSNGGVPAVELGPVAPGTLLAYLGVLLCLSWLLDSLGRHPRGPLAWRLALRDGARNRSRATATVAASTAIAALVALVMVGVSSSAASDRGALLRDWRMGVGSVQMADGSLLTDAAWQQGRRQFAGVLPVRRDAPLREPLACDPVTGCQNPVAVDVDPSCAALPCTGRRSVAAFDEQVFQVLVGRSATPEERDVVLSGGVLLGQGAPGRGSIALENDDSGRSLTVASLHVDGLNSQPLASEATLRRLAPGVKLASKQHLVDTGVTPTPDQAVAVGVDGEPLGLVVRLQAPPTSPVDGVLGWAAPFGGAVMLAVAGLAGALALRDARASHVAMAAVGATRRTLRGMAAVQVLVATGLGTALGLLLGTLPMALLRATSPVPVVLDVPWGWLAALLVAVPVGSALVTLLLARPPRPRAVRAA